MESKELKDKLYNYHETPDASVWNSIVGALHSPDNISEKLFKFEQKPPAEVWQKVASSLNTEPAKVIPLYIRFKKEIKYAAIASVLIFVAATSYLSINKKETEPASIVQVEQQATPVPSQPPIVKQDKVELAETEPDVTTAVVKRDVIIKSPTTAQRILKFLKPHTLTTSLSAPKKIETELRTTIQHIDYENAERLMVYPDLDGKPVRLSKKLFEVVHCNDGDQSCNHKVQNLQQKVSNATLTADFLGFIEILKQVQEN